MSEKSGLEPPTNQMRASAGGAHAATTAMSPMEESASLRTAESQREGSIAASRFQRFRQRSRRRRLRFHGIIRAESSRLRDTAAFRLDRERTLHSDPDDQTVDEREDETTFAGRVDVGPDELAIRSGGDL